MLKVRSAKKPVCYCSVAEHLTVAVSAPAVHSAIKTPGPTGESAKMNGKHKARRGKGRGGVCARTVGTSRVDVLIPLINSNSGATLITKDDARMLMEALEGPDIGFVSASFSHREGVFDFQQPAARPMRPISEIMRCWDDGSCVVPQSVSVGDKHKLVVPVNVKISPSVMGLWGNQWDCVDDGIAHRELVGIMKIGNINVY